MSQKQFKRYRKAGHEAAQKTVNDNLVAIRDQLLKNMVDKNILARLRIAILIVFSKVH